MRGLNRQYTKAILIKIRYYNRKKTLKSSYLPPPPPPPGHFDQNKILQ